MGSDVRIVGVCLLRNEEYFAAWSLMNAAAFCDRILVMDNRSEDRTRRIVEAVAGVHPHIEILDVRKAHGTHKYLEPLAGTPTWVFPIDGDEIHHPAGLARLRPCLMAGEFDGRWMVVGHMLNVLGIATEEASAFGYSWPEAGGIARLYNFHAIESWRGGSERLHGGRLVFRPGYAKTVHDLRERETWDESAFRCLHLCFMPRSSRDKMTGGEWTGRENPAQFKKERFLYQRLRRAVRRRFNPNVSVYRDYKKRVYARGPVREFDIPGFGAPSDFRAVDPDCDEAMAVLRAATERRERSGCPAAG